MNNQIQIKTKPAHSGDYHCDYCGTDTHNLVRDDVGDHVLCRACYGQEYGATGEYRAPVELAPSGTRHVEIIAPAISLVSAPAGSTPTHVLLRREIARIQAARGHISAGWEANTHPGSDSWIGTAYTIDARGKMHYMGSVASRETLSDCMRAMVGRLMEVLS